MPKRDRQTSSPAPLFFPVGTFLEIDEDTLQRELRQPMDDTQLLPERTPSPDPDAPALPLALGEWWRDSSRATTVTVDVAEQITSAETPLVLTWDLLFDELCEREKKCEGQLIP